MANQTSLGKLIVPGYLIPLRQAHATVASMVSRMEAAPNDGISFMDRAQPKEADQALRVAHNILLDVLRVQDEHFFGAAFERAESGLFAGFRRHLAKDQFATELR